MRVGDGFERFEAAAHGSVVTIGNFDGLHLGHRSILATARDAARRHDAELVVVTFEPHPAAILNPQRAPARLTTLDERLALLRGAGVDQCIALRTDAALLAQTAEAFLHTLATRCRPRAIVEGPDFNFGRGRGGSIQTLRDNAARYGYGVFVVEAVRCAALPGAPQVSSSAIRAALRAGEVAAASAMLGRPHRVCGTVGGGASRGAGLGFPTANLEAIPHLLPGEAVYAAVAELADGSRLPAAVNVGPQPTFGQSESRVEAHLLSFSGELRGQRLGLHFVERLRGQTKFAGVKELVEQLGADVARTRAIVEQCGEADGWLSGALG